MDKVNSGIGVNEPTEQIGAIGVEPVKQPVNVSETIQTPVQVDKQEKTIESQVAVPETIEDNHDVKIIGGQPDVRAQNALESPALETNTTRDQATPDQLHAQAHLIKNSPVTSNESASALFKELEKLKQKHQQN